MPLNKLENFIKNYEGRILYVNSNDLDATDSITNQGNSLTKPFKTIQRALIEAARFSFVTGNDNDKNDRTTILVFPGEHLIDNRPGYGIRKTGTATAEAESPSGSITATASDVFNLTLESNFDLTQEDNVLYKFNSIYGGVILPRGTSLIGLDLRKTKIRPKYVPNPTDSAVPNSSIFRITGNCYFWQFSLFDANPDELVYTNNQVFSQGSGNLSLPTFSHHKLTCFEYADGVNVPTGYDITDLDMYYAKLSQAFNEGSGRQIPASQKYPLSPLSFAKERPEWEIVGAFGTDDISISSIISGDGATPNSVVTVTTVSDHGLTAGTPIKIRGVNVNDYNISTVVQTVTNSTTFTYLLPFVRNDLSANPSSGSATVTIETDTVKGASPYIFNCSLRSVWGMNGMLADGSKASGFKSMVVAQFTAVSLQKDDRAFVKYDPTTRVYNGITISKTTGSQLSSQSSSTITSEVYHLDTNAIYRPGWESSHIKITNDSFIQIVSVFAIGFNKQFDVQSGGDGSVTNSNSNFGQFALAAEGFRKEAFTKDDNAYITSIITPRHIQRIEKNIDWISIDVGLTTAVGNQNHLYLYGFNTEDNVPPNLIQGYRIGAKVEDTLHLTLPNGTVSSARILMTNNTITSGILTATGTNSSLKEYTVSTVTTSPNFDTLTLSSSHVLQTGEKILILSETGDLPENITENKIYYAINNGSTSIKVASSLTNAQNGIPITMYGGTRLKVLSRVSDRNSGELGSPIQYDPNHSNWFIHVEGGNTIYSSLNSIGVAGFEEPRTDVTFVKRIEDSRSLDEKIYKVRLVIPKESVNAKDPSEGFVIQESSSTGPVSDSEFTLSSINAQNYNYKRNPRFISTCSETSGTVTVVTELPHDLTTGDRVLIKNVKSSTNLSGVGVTGYNGDFTVTVTNNKTFTYSTTDNSGVTHNVGIFSAFTERNKNIPRFQRNDLKSNLFVYRSEVLSPYIYNVQDGVYHLYVLKADNAVSNTFTDYKYGQNVVNLYPQKDPDNIDDNPQAATTYAKTAPLGDVVTSDLKKSITRETLDTVIKKFGAGITVQSATSVSGGISTITTTHNHGLNGIVGYTTLTTGTGYSIGTYFNVRLLNQSDNSWNGAAADLVVSGAGSSITSLSIVDGGAGYGATTLSIEGFAGSTLGITTRTISNAVGNSLQITGLGTVTDSLYRITSIPSRNQIAVAKTSGDPSIISNQYIFNVAPSSEISTVGYTTATGIATATCSSAHGLVAGNSFKIVDSSNNSIGEFVVSDVVGVTTFIFSSTTINPTNANRVLKHGFSANALVSETGTENLAARGVSFYANESATLLTTLGSGEAGISTFAISPVNSGISTLGRFPLGSYIQINNEIMRITSSTLSGSGNNEITVLRGVLGTQKATHSSSSLIKKIAPIAVELRRPSILRASGHTFEYLGFGPGNYSTGLPQIQSRSLTEREDFLSQSQEKACGSVIYTGMNSDGDFFIGNTKYSSTSGEQTTFDIPIPTVTGQDPSRLSAVFDEVIVKERILVEGGKSKKVLSQFDGPVTFNENVIINNEQTKINGELINTGLMLQKNTTDSSTPTTGSIVTRGGLGVVKSVNIGGNLNITGITTFNGDVAFNNGLVPDSFEGAFIGTDAKPWASAWIGGIGIATGGTPGGSEVEDRTITGLTGDLVLTSIAGIVSVTDSLEVSDDLLVKRNARVVGLSTFQDNVHLLDNDKLQLGGAIGTVDGLEIYHDGSNSYINDSGTGELRIQTSALRVRNAANDETGILFTQDSAVGLYFNNSEKLATTNDGLNITGITTASGGFFPLSDSGGPLGSLNLSFSEAFIDNLKLDGNTFSSTSGGITLDAADNQISTSDNVSITGITTISGKLEVDNLRLDGNTFDTKSGNLTLDAATNSVIIDSDLSVTGVTTFTGALNLGGDLLPSTDLGAKIGSSSKRWSEAWIGNLQFAVGTTGNTETTITTSAGGLFLDSAGGTTTVDDDLTVSGDIRINGNDILASDGSTNITLNSNTITTFAGDIKVSGNDIQSSTATALTLSGSDVTVQGDLTVSGNDIKSSTATALTLSGANVTIPGTLTVDGNTTLGNANSDVTTVNGELRVTQDIVAYYSSDRRFKDNIQPIDNSLAKLLQVSGNTYTWNSESSKTGNDVGVIAQEIQAVLPEAVIERDNGYLAVDYHKIIPLLIESIKELNDKVEKLEQKLSDK